MKLIVKASPGTLYWINVFNGNAAARYVQVHDAVDQPADTAVPLASFLVGIGADREIRFGPYGLPCGTGIVLVSSTTQPTLTAGAADMFATATYK